MAGARPRTIVLALLTSLALLTLAAGCTSWRGAQLYQSGTRALEAGEVDRALRDLNEAARLVPEGSEIQNHLGVAWLEAGDEQRALQSFERAVELDCDNQAAADNLARIEERLRERAIEHVSGPRPKDGDDP
jgi:Flp pilus assembly protein TadD